MLGSIYDGYATPLRGGSGQRAATLLLTALNGQPSWAVFAQSLIGATTISAMVCPILVAAAFLSTAMGYLHVPQDLASAIGALELSPYGLIAILTCSTSCSGFHSGRHLDHRDEPADHPAARGAGRLRSAYGSGSSW